MSKRKKEEPVIRVKLTKNGGYVVGDGPCPVDPDDFIIRFGAKIIEAQRAGLEEIGFSQAQIDFMLAEKRLEWSDQITGTPVREVKNIEEALA